jgi:tRNA nucleotidyltransferase/poly(A) polymerase
MPEQIPLTLPPLVKAVRAILPDDQAVYLVGGAIRDALLGRTSHDLDFVLSADGIRTARRIADALRADFFPLDPERDTGRVIATSPDGLRYLMDFAVFRGPDLEADLRGRDFTVNAVAMEIHTGQILDPLHGGMDLKARRLQTCTPGAFQDDPVRIYRAARLGVAYGFNIPPETAQAMRTAVGGLAKVSIERLRDELFRILEGPRRAGCLSILDQIGALDQLLPELRGLKGCEQPAPHVHDVWEHTLAAVRHLELLLTALTPPYDPEASWDWYLGLAALRLGRYRSNFAEHLAAGLNVNRSVVALLGFATLYHDVAKPESRKVDEQGQVRFWDHDARGAEIAVERARALNLSNDEAERLDLIIRNHMRILFHTNRLVNEGKQLSRRGVYRFFRDTRQAGVDVALLSLADLRATYEQTLPQDTWRAGVEVCRLLLENWWERPQESVTPPVLIGGRDLMAEYDLEPGPKVGELLEAVREAQAMGQVTTRQEALNLVRQLLKTSSLSSDQGAASAQETGGL